MKAVQKLTTFLLLFLLPGFIIQCSSSRTEQAASSESTHSHEAESHHADDEGSAASHKAESSHAPVITILETQAQTIGLELGKLDTVTMGSVIQSYGWLRLPPQYHARVSTFFSGRIDTIFVIEGDFVHKGDTLALISSPEVLELQEAYIRSIAEFQFAKAEFQRQQQLYKDSIAAAKQLQMAEANFLTRQSQMLALEKKLQLANLNPEKVRHSTIVSTFPILAPMNSYVRHIRTTLGEFVSPGQELFELVNNAHIHADIFVFERDIPKVRVGQTVRFSLSTQPNKWYKGKIFAIGKAFEDSVKAVIVHAELLEPGASEVLLPGMFVNAHIVTATHTVMAVPEAAVVEIDGQPHIFIFAGKVSHPDGEALQFRAVPVKTGEQDLGYVAVTLLQPIPPEAQIVTHGAYYIYAQIQNFDTEHAH